MTFPAVNVDTKYRKLEINKETSRSGNRVMVKLTYLRNTCRMVEWLHTD